MTRNLPSPQRRLHRLLAGLSLVLASLSAPALAAVDIKGARFDDTYQLGNQSLSLNGAGTRVKVIIDVYAAGLYVPQRGRDAGNLLAQNGPKSLQIVLLRELTGEDFADAMVKGFVKNNGSADQARFQPKIDEIRNLMMSFGKVRKGAVIHIDFTPSAGTSVTIDGVRKGPEIAGDEFFTALLRIWLGNAPVDADLKASLLGAR
jgi:Chalcone isomerase-like